MNQRLSKQLTPNPDLIKPSLNFPLQTLIFCALVSPAAPTLADGLIEEILIYGKPETKAFESISTKPQALSRPDSAAQLKLVPGADVNSNGPLTGIAQYRGMYGDRVAVTMDGESVLGGGPNAMDAPLSYAPPQLLSALHTERGIASVASAQEAIGGRIDAELNRGKFADSEAGAFSAMATSQFNNNDHGFNSALRAVGANRRHKFALLSVFDEGGDAESGDGDSLRDTGYRRVQYDLSYGWRGEGKDFALSFGQLDTNDTGTPALPMDIRFIKTDIANASYSSFFNGIELKTRIGYRDVDHLMDNFSLRTNTNPMRYRQNRAQGRQLSWGLGAEIPLKESALKVGIDATETQHDALITNPNMSMFAVRNFADARRDVHGVFTQWQGRQDGWDIESGLRYNRVSLNSEEVFALGMMGMMAGAASTLANDFNQSSRSRHFNNIDLVLKLGRPFNDSTRINLGLGHKTRAPSYQELYLWLPLEATGGLADGRTYIGNLDLDSEVNHEFTLGLDWQQGRYAVEIQSFYRRVDDYIQGTPSTNASAIMLATMMSGQAPLQFNNIDAELYGIDGAYSIIINDNWRLDGMLGYVRGKNRDDGDNLYRIAPLNHRLKLSWRHQDLTASLESVMYAAQSKTAKFNSEQKTGGYGLLNLYGEYQVTAAARIHAGIENVLDKNYADHLGGYNRNADSDIGIGDRLPGRGRGLYAGVTVDL